MHRVGNAHNLPGCVFSATPGRPGSRRGLAAGYSQNQSNNIAIFAKSGTMAAECLAGLIFTRRP
jgi:hypothetical protein